MKKNDVIKLKISSIAAGGSGIGRADDGCAVFVPYSAAGDVAEVQILKVDKRCAFGKINSLETPSPDRIESDCGSFGRCGGCALRHISYSAELSAKRGFVVDALSRIGGLDCEVEECLPSPDTERYRNKAQYPVFNGESGLDFGFYSRRSHRVVHMEDCLLEPEIMHRAARCACKILTDIGLRAYDETTRKGLVRHLLMRRSGSGELLLCVVINGRGFKGQDEFAKRLAEEIAEIKTVVINENTKPDNVILGERFRTVYGDGFIEDTLCGVPVRLFSPSFFQINKPSAERLYGEVYKLAEPCEGDTVLDLYCGAGTIGLSIAARTKLGALIGAETVPEAVEAARLAAQRMGAQNCEFLTADAGAAAAELAKRGLRPDIAITDPPRKGCSTETLDALLKMSPEKIVMVSCNAATLARDLKYLTANGYAVGRVQPVDLFPRTEHIEVACLLTLVK